MGKISEVVYSLADPVVKAQKLKLVDVDFLKEGSDWVLRIFIENPGDQDLRVEDCEKVSRIVSDELDRVDPIDKSYILEVSSPGLERPLKDKEDYQRFTGELVRIKTYAPIEGQKEFVGTLLKFEDNKVSLELKDDEGVMGIPFSKIAHGNLTIDF